MAHNYKIASLLTLVLISLFVRGASCQESFGAWAFGVSDDNSYLYAATLNDSQEMLGQFCYPKKGSCLWIVSISDFCTKGDQYPVLANANSASAQLSIACYGPFSKGKYSYAFTDFDLVDKLIKANVEVGFAIPIQGDKFRVVRFSLSGATAAVANMRSAARKMMGARKPAPPTGTRDQII